MLKNILKKILLLLALTSISYASTPLADYRLDECSWNGTVEEVIEQSGNFNATAKNGATTTSAQISYGGNFDGSDDYILLPSINGGFDDGITISAWVDFGDVNSYERVVELSSGLCDGDWCSNNYISLWRGGSDDIVRFQIRAGTDDAGTHATASIQSGIHHYVATYNHSNGEAKIYVDGDLKDTQTWDTSKFDPNALRDHNYIAKTIWDEEDGDSDMDYPFGGIIDEVKIYNGALSDSEVQDIYDNEKNSKNYDGSTRSSECSANLTPWVYYKFDESSYDGTSGEVKDTQGNKDATSSSATIDSDGQINNSAKFVSNGKTSDDTSGQYIQLPDMTTNFSAGFSYVGWVKFNNGNDAGDTNDYDTVDGDNYSWERIFDLGSKGPNGSFSADDHNDAISFGRYGDTNKLYFSMYGGDDGTVRGADVRSADDVITPDTWQFLAISVENDGTTKLYVNAQEVSSSTDMGWGSGVNGNSDHYIRDTSRTHSYIGRSNWNSNYYSDARFDETRFYNKALTASEIQAIYDNEKSNTNLSLTPILEYKFDECIYNGISGEVKDNSQNNIDATAINTAVKQNGMINGSANFNADGYIVAQDDLLNTTENEFSISFWFKTNADANNSDLVSKIDYSNKMGYEIWIYDDGKLVLSEGNTSDMHGWYASDDVITTDTWHHVVFTHNSSDLSEVYLDNVKQLSVTFDVVLNDVDLLIGAYKADNSDYRFNGNIDEFKIYDSVLSESKISDIYNNEKSQKNYDGSDRELVSCLNGWFRFDKCDYNGNIEEVKDSSPLGYDSNTSTIYPHTSDLALIGKSLDLHEDYDSDYILLNNSVMNDLDRFSISLWLKSAGTGSNEYILSSNSNQFNLYLTDDSTLKVQLLSNSTTYDLSSNTITDNNWHNLVLLRDENNLTLYVDKIKIATKTLDDTSKATLNISDLKLGQDNSPSSSSDFEGYIDELKIWSGLLSETKINSYYDNEYNTDVTTANKNFDKTIRDAITCPVNLWIEDQNCTEGNSDSTTCYIFVKLDTPTTNDIHLKASTADGDTEHNATTDDNDYNAITNQDVTIIAGDLANVAIVEVNGDTKLEYDEIFKTIISDVTVDGYTTDINITQDTSNNTIINDDNVTITIENNSCDEDIGSCSFLVNMTGESDHALTINFNTVDDSATSNDDYTAVSGGSIIIPAGTNTQTNVTVDIIDDTAVESDENFNINLIDIDGDFITSNDSAIATIKDNDAKIVFNMVDQVSSCNSDAWDDPMKTKITQKEATFTIISKNESDGNLYPDVNITKIEFLGYSDSDCTQNESILDESWNGLDQTNSNGCLDKAFTFAKAIRCVKAHIYGNSNGVDFDRISDDKFSIRPDRFILSSSSDLTQKLISQEDYDFNIKAVDYASENATLDYNTSLDLNITKLYKDDSEDDGNLNGDFTLNPNANLNFSNGDSGSVDFSFSDVGKVKLNLIDKHWSDIDINDSSENERFIKFNINLEFIADHFLVQYDTNKPTINNFNNNSFTYLANERDLMYASLKDMNFKITALGKKDNIVKNYHLTSSDNFYASKLDITPTLTMPYSSDLNTSSSLLSENGVDLNFNHGIAVKNYTNIDFNYKRDSKNPKNPFIVDGSNTTIKVDVNDHTNSFVVGSSAEIEFDNSATFYFGKISTKDVKTAKTPKSSKLLAEVYWDGSGSKIIPNSYEQITNSWYVNADDELSITNRAQGDYYPRKYIKLNSNDLSSEVSINPTSINKAEINFDISRSDSTKSLRAYIHIDIPTWLWYSKYNKYSFDSSSSCAMHPCFEYIFTTIDDDKGISSGEFNGVGFENNFTNKSSSKNIKVLR